MYRSTLFCLIAGMLFACQVSNADDITIPAGTTVTTEVLLQIGDNLNFNGTSDGSPNDGIQGLGANTIEVGTTGLIQDANRDGIRANASGSQISMVTNYGLIQNNDDEGIQAISNDNSQITVYNYGTILNNTNDGLDAIARDNSSIWLFNYGFIGAMNEGGIEVDSFNNARVYAYNYGTMRGPVGSYDGFDLDSDDNSMVIVYNYGTIEDFEDGFDVDPDDNSTAYLYNYGTVRNTTSEAFDVDPDDNSTVYLYNYGVIEDSTDAIEIDPDNNSTVYLYNYGVIQNNSLEGIDLEVDDNASAFVYNHGTVINSGDNGVEVDVDPNASLSFTHTGYILNSTDTGIDSDNSGGQLQLIIKSGVIRNSGSGNAMTLGSGNANVTIQNRAVIEGISDAEGGTDTLNIRARGLTQADIDSVNALNGPAQQTFTLHGESFTIQNFENFTFEFEQYADLLPSDCFGDFGSRLDNASGYSEEIRLYYGALDMTPAGTMLQDYVNNFTGRSTAGAMAFSSLDESLVFSDTLLHRVYPAARTVGPANDEDPWTFWVSGRNSTLEQGRNKFQGAYSYRSETGTFGADYRKSENCTLGFLASYTTARSTTDSFGSNYEEDVMRFAVYGTHTNGPWFFDGLLGYSSHDYDTARAIGIPTGFYQATSQLGGSMAYGGTSGDQFSSYIRAGYDFEIGEGDNPWVLTPLAGLHYYGLSVNDFSESGSFANLRFNDLSAESFRTQLSLLLSKTHHFDNGAWVRPSLYASWYYDALDDPGSYNASIAGSGLGNFGVDLYRGDRSLLLAGISLFAAPTGNDNFNVFFNWGVESGADDFTSHNVSGGIRLQFD